MKQFVAALLLASGIVYLGYFVDRTDFTSLITAFAISFASYFYIIKSKHNTISLGAMLRIAILLRFLLIFPEPGLSDDYFRFLWDGNLLAAGLGPFDHLPSYYMSADFRGSLPPGITSQLFENLNSPEYFTIYPPVCQFIFFLCGKFFPGNIHAGVLLMKTSLFLFETGSIMIGLKLLKSFGRNKKDILLYALNPLVIIELTGNLHFEAAMIFFLLMTIYALHQKRFYAAAIPFALSISSKLIPLIFLPLLIKRYGWRKTFLFSTITILLSLILFVPVIDLKTAGHLLQSISLYFNKFEFNAGIYYLFREIGFVLTGYNMIIVIGKGLAMLSIAIILLLAFRQKNLQIQSLPLNMLFVLSTYLLFSTTVHPWYICTLVMLSIFTRFRFALAWSALACLSYYAYGQANWQESMCLISIEYITVFSILTKEVLECRKRLGTSLIKK